MNRLRDLREDADLNQTEVAKFLGMSQTGYSKYETEENDIPTKVLIKLAGFYNRLVNIVSENHFFKPQKGGLKIGYHENLDSLPEKCKP